MNNKDLIELLREAEKMFRICYDGIYDSRDGTRKKIPAYLKKANAYRSAADELDRLEAALESERAVHPKNQQKIETSNDEFVDNDFPDPTKELSTESANEILGYHQPKNPEIGFECPDCGFNKSIPFFGCCQCGWYKGRPKNRQKKISPLWVTDDMKLQAKSITSVELNAIKRTVNELIESHNQRLEDNDQQ